MDLPDSGWQRIGDANQDGRLDISDPVRILRGLFLGGPDEPPCDGESFTEGGNLAILDVNDGRSLPAVPPLRGGPLTSRRDLLHTRLTMPERLHALSLGDIFPEDPVDFDSTTRPVEPK